MQFEDPRSMLESAAAKPARGIDAAALIGRGRRLRRARYAAVAGGLAVTLAAASASFGMLDRRGRPTPPANAGCDSSTRSLAIFLRRDASDADAHRLQARLEENPDVERVEYVAPEETAEMFRELSVESGGLPPGFAPAQLRVVARDGAGAERLAEMRGSVIDTVIPGLGGGLTCLVQEVCDGSVPLVASVFLRDGADDAEVLELRDRLLATPGIVKVRYVSETRAYAEFRRLYLDRPELYETIDAGDLPASLRVRAADQSALDRVQYLESPVVDEVRIAGALTSHICDGEASPSPTPSNDSGDQGQPVDEVPEVQPEVLGTECGVGPLHFSRTQLLDFPERKWCRFEFAVFNAGTEPVVFRYEDVLLHTSVTPIEPWLPDGEPPTSAGSLFAGSVGPGTTATGQVAFLLMHDHVPTKVELWRSPRNLPFVFLLGYHDCLTDLRDDPDGKCSFEATLQSPPPYDERGPVEVTLYHCGIDPVVFAGREWVVPSPPFDATNAPADFAGKGRMKMRSEAEAVYVDRSGVRVTFRAVQGWQPPPCG